MIKIIVQARMGSSRLPGKMMMPIIVTIEMTLISMAIIITEVGGLITVVDGEMITITMISLKRMGRQLT